MNGRGPKLYAFLARLPWPKSYLGKIMLSVFLGIHVPLIALVLYLVFAASTDLRASLSVLVIVFVATLFGTVLPNALCALRFAQAGVVGLKGPVRMSTRSWRRRCAP